jgi:SAM-dependent methyltransferase
MRWNKPCEVEDFHQPEMASALRALFPREAVASAEWPRGAEYRKHWEICMVMLAMQAFLEPERRQFALGVGAGTEATTFLLTHHFRWVFATDLYATADWSGDSPPNMLTQPANYAGGFPFQNRRLVVQHMDARQIQHEDATFDLVYSCGSIEHFGTREQIRQAAGEMGRVLKPGGIIAISTEFCVRGAPGYVEKDTLLLSQLDLVELIVEPSGCTPVDALCFNISAATLNQPVVYADALRDRVRMLQGRQTAWSQYPHIVIDNGERAWTSYHLTLRKPCPPSK